MNPNFSEWFRAANLDPQKEILTDRWQGIENFCEKKINTNDIFELVRLFFQKHGNNDFRENFIKTFADVDSAFPKKNEMELSVLAGVTLINVIKNNNKLGTLVMLTCKSISFLNSTPSVQDILVKIEKKFQNKTAKIRENLVESPKINFDLLKNEDLLKNLTTDVETNAWTPANKSANFISFFKNLQNILTEIEEALSSSEKERKIFREDSQILWWMTGEWCDDLKTPYKELDIATASVVSGKELADLVNVFPGPYSTYAVLKKMLPVFDNDSNKTKTLTSTVDSLSREWRKNTIEDYPPNLTKELTPIITAIEKSLEVQKTKVWAPVFEGLTGYTSNSIKPQPIDLAYQVYLECVLIKYLNVIKD